MRDFVCLHARLAVPDGLTHQPIYPLSPATADTAVAGRETCAHGATHLPPGRRSDMSPTTHDSLARGHRVREFVCTYRTLNPRSEWITKEVPELRIISNELWEN